MAQKKMYSEEFKRDAIRLQETSGKSIGTIEKELGLSHNLLRQWKKRYQVNHETDELERSEIEQLKAELRQAKRELELARQERDILKNSAYLLEGHDAMTYACVKACADEFPVARVCALLQVSESGYYAWLKRTPSQREQAKQSLKARIMGIWEQFKQCYGAPRIHAELQAQGFCVGQNRVARLMQRLGIRGKGGQKRRPRTTQADASHLVAPNILAQEFGVEQPDTVWLTDITYIDTDDGFLYIAGVMDLYSRQIIGLAMAEHMRSELTETALEMALCHRQPDPSLIHHSDRGSQYTCSTYQQLLINRGITVSMSRTGNCLDNAPMQSFWATLKRECADDIFASFQQARTEIFGYIMGFYNRVRRHSALDYLSPHDYEMQFLRQTCTLLNSGIANTVNT